MVSLKSIWFDDEGLFCCSLYFSLICSVPSHLLLLYRWINFNLFFWDCITVLNVTVWQRFATVERIKNSSRNYPVCPMWMEIVVVGYCYTEWFLVIRLASLCRYELDNYWNKWFRNIYENRTQDLIIIMLLAAKINLPDSNKTPLY